MALTELELKALRPLEKTFTVTDAHGLYVEVLPSGSMVWRFRYQFKGKTEKLTLGHYPTVYT